ncbi:hypothetical protein [Nitrosovibrio sp. Nv6]|uniref:hypothetical protein n=1 Tax=Nitrosovibrio sp. Nv6 TaxID=1855340 RepID=UPI0008AE7FCE|nr:hypothetical protein [Nitrosovibrio sp. Nv6]SEP05000.1 hypothetical protein SAMN05216316_1580 [Nitrosovibrio sp. Nv6]
MKRDLSLILLSGCLLSTPLYAEESSSPESGDASSQSYTIDLYVDTKTKQIYSEPGEGRVRMGSFEKVADKPKKPAANERRGDAVASGTGKDEGGALLRDVPNSVEKSQAVGPEKPKGGFGYANWKEKDPFKFNLNPDGSQYVKFGFLNQAWLRYEQNNPGSSVLGEPVDDTTDISLRRTRFVLQGQLTDRVYFYTQYGMNNFNFLSQNADNRKLQSFFHDAFGELRLTQGHQMIVGGGLVMANGLSRFSSPSVSTIMTMDVPLFAQATADRTDIFNRKLSLYLRGQIGNLNYRVSASDSFPINTSGLAPEPISLANAQFARTGHRKQYQGFFMWNFWDKEPMTNPYMQGTYLGKKSILNLEAGFITQKNATWTGASEATADFHDMNLWSVAGYLDAPVDKVKETAISAYLGYFNTNYGPNYLRANGNGVNPTNGSSAAFIGGGNAFPMFGTGDIWYGQIGYLMAKQLLGGNNGQLMPYFSFTSANFDRLRDQMNVFSAGVNWLIKGHNSKVTFDFQNRPVFNSGGFKVSNRNQFVLQYQIAF